nr:hypothetical protein [Sinirhodobacter populi]
MPKYPLETGASSLCDDVFDPSFDVTDLGVQHGLRIIIHALDPGGDVVLPACALRAKSRLRMSAIWALRVVKVLRIRRFSLGNLRPASGVNSMNRAMSLASIRPVFARVPRERAKSLIRAGGSCKASIPAVTSLGQSTHLAAPLLAACRPEPNPHRPRQILDLCEKLGMACSGVGQAQMPIARRTKPSSQSRETSIPITVVAGLFAVPQNGPPSTVRDGEERRDQPASDRGQATRCSALYPTPSSVLAGIGGGVSITGLRHIRCLIPGLMV